MTSLFRDSLNDMKKRAGRSVGTCTLPVCSVDDCQKTVHLRSLCCAHYRRWLRHGDPLAGRTPCGEPLRWLREVALPYVDDDCLIWPFTRNTRGYGQITYEGRRTVASRIICEMINGPAPSPDHDAAHSCGRGHLGCVAPGHLAWKTKSQNQADRLTHGTDLRGEDHPNAKLTEEDVLQIRALVAAGVMQKEAGRRFGVTKHAVYLIIKRKTWGWL